jgi:hypothetical protein
MAQNEWPMPAVKSSFLLAQLCPRICLNVPALVMRNDLKI